jgi:hypothetical protein
MTAVTITAMAAGGLALGAPMPLFSSPYMSTTPVRANDAAPDGRLLMIMPDEASAPPVTDVTIVINWFDELRRRAPVAGLRSP